MSITDLFLPSIETARTAATLAVNILVQSSLIIAAGLFAARLLRRYGAAVQATVLRVTLIGVLACPLASWLLAAIGVSGFGVELPLPEQFALSSAPAAEAALPVVVSATTVNTQREYADDDAVEVVGTHEPATLFSGPDEFAYEEEPFEKLEAPQPPAAAAALVRSETSVPRIRVSVAESPAPAAAAVAPIARLYGVVVAAWSLVAVLLAARIVLANAFVLQGRVRAVAADRKTVSICQQLARAIGVRLPPVLISPRIQSPCLVGLLRPAILLPATMKSISRDVLVHELAHLRRRDCVWQLLSCLTTTAVWFQPLTWLLSRRLEQTADDVADDFVVQYGNDRADYARQLVDIAQRYQPEWSAACVGAGIVSFKSSLGKRVVRILDTSRSLSTRTGLVALTAIVLFGATCTLAVGLLGTGSVRAEPVVSGEADGETNEGEDAGLKAPTEDDKNLTVRGRVLDPSGQPFSGAKLYLVADLGDEFKDRPLATSDQEGRFDFSVPKSKFDKRYSAEPWKMGSVVAVADGLGPGAVFFFGREPGEPFELQLAKADLPVTGRILDLQGQPVSGVRVKLNSLHIPIAGAGGVGAWRNALQARRDGMEVQRRFFTMVSLPSFLANQETRTDENGKFSLPAMGRDRIVSLFLEGPAIQSQEICIVSRENLPPISAPWYERAPTLGTLHYYATGSDHVAGPTRPVIGVVTDQKTGKPLAGFRVAGRHVGNPLQPVETETDEQGRFRLTGLALKRDQTLTVSPPEDLAYLEIERDIHLPVEDEPLVVDFQVRRGVWAEGRVVDARTGKPERARISYFAFVTNEARGELVDSRLARRNLALYNNEDGTFRIPVLPGRGIIAARGFSDRYLMGIGADKIDGPKDRTFFRTSPFLCSSASFHTLVEVNPGDDDERIALKVALDPGEIATGRVTGPDGKPLAGAHIRGMHAMSYWRESAAADFEVTGMGQGRERQLLFFHQERNLAGRAVVKPSQDRVSFKLQPAGTLVGRLFDEGGLPWANVKIRSQNPGYDRTSELEHDFIGLPQSLNIVTDGEGRFRIPGLVPGLKYSFGVDEGVMGGTDFIRDAVVEQGETKDLGDLKPLGRAAANQGAGLGPVRAEAAVAAPSQRIQGRVADEQGRPIANAVLYMNSPRMDEYAVQTTSAADGQFEFTVEAETLRKHWTAGGKTPVRIVCRAKGFGFQFHDLVQSELDQPLVFQLPQDIAVEGRLVSFEGRPVAGARVHLERAFGVPGGLDTFLQAVEDPHGNPYGVIKRPWDGPLPGEPSSVRTDSDGRFRLTGLGRERFILLDIKGSGFANTSAYVMTRKAKPVLLGREFINGIKFPPTTYYGATFEYVVGPERKIVGLVRDAKTKKPVAGAKVGHNLTGLQSMVTGEDGRYELRGYPKSSDYRVAVFETPSPFFLAQAMAADQPGLDAVHIDFDLVRGIPLRGKVTDAAGRPVRGRVRYEPLFPNSNVARIPRLHSPCSHVRIQADGSFEIPVLPGPGVLAVRAATDDGYQKAQVTQDQIASFFADGHKRMMNGRLMTAGGGQAMGILSPGVFNAIALVNPKDHDKALVRNIQLRRVSPPQSNSAESGIDAENAPPARRPALTAKASLPDEATRQRRITGVVLGDDGKPFPGASVFVGTGDWGGDDSGVQIAKPLEVKSDAGGRFEITCRGRDFFENPQAVPKMIWERLSRSVYIVAAAPGFGPGWVRGLEDEPRTLQLVPDTPIVGQLVTLEGAPAANARVRLGTIQAAPDNNVEPWLDALRSGQSMWKASVEYKHQNIVPNVFGMAAHMTTDEQGRFRITGIGRDRIVRLFVIGPSVARTVFRVVARRTEPLPTNLRSADLDGDKVYGANFQHIVAPSQPIVGVLRDAETDVPLPQVRIESYQLAGSKLMGVRTNLLQTHTDAEGRFRLEGMPKGRGNRLLAVPNDRQPYFMREIPIPATEGLGPINVDVEMHRGIWITGKVVDKVTREPVMASMKYLPMLSNKYAEKLPEFTTLGGGLVEGGLGYQHRYTTKPDGSFRVVGLPGRAVVGAETMSKHRGGAGSEKIAGMDSDGRLPTYNNPIRASKTWPNVMAEINPAADAESASVILEADPGADLQVTVSDDRGQPITGYRVSGQVTSSTWGEPIEQPSFTLTGLAPSAARTILIHHAARRLGKAFRVKAGERALKVQLQPCAIVRGRLLDEDGDSVAKASLRAFTKPREDYNPYLPSISTDDQGRFEFSAIPAGTEYHVQVRLAGGGTRTNVMTFAPQAGETLVLGNVKLQASVKKPLANAVAADKRPVAPSEAVAKKRLIRGTVTDADGQPAAGAFVAVVAVNVQPKAGASHRSQYGEVLGEATAGAGGEFELLLGDATSKTRTSPNIIARTQTSGIAWQQVNLDVGEANVKLVLQPQQLLQGRLVDIEGRPVGGLPIVPTGLLVTGDRPTRHLGYPELKSPPRAWLPPITTDARGIFTVRNVAGGDGVTLKVAGTETIAPQDLAFNTGMREQRGATDATYRSLVKNIQPGEVATIALAPAQFFEGVVLLGDSDQPAANARITIWASQQEFGGSMISVEGRTDPQGRFRLSPKPGIRFGIIAYPPPGSPHQVKRLNDLRWESGAGSKNIKIRLDQGMLARGWVVDAETEQPLKNASVQYLPDRINNKNLTSDIVTGWQSIQKTNEDGEFQITVLPGPGTLLVHAADRRYILQERGSRELDRGKRGGARTYAHAFRKIDPVAGEPFEALKIKLQQGESVQGTVTNVQGDPVERTLVVSRLKIVDHSPQWRGFPDEALAGSFQLSGLRRGEEYPVYFLDPQNRLGAAATISTKNKSPTIVLEPCGSAKARFVGPDGRPSAGQRYGLHMVVTPGKSKYDLQAMRRGETVADEDFAENIDRVNYRSANQSDDNGEMFFPALIPRARYRFISFANGGPRISREFVAKSGQTYDMGEIEVEVND